MWITFCTSCFYSLTLFPSLGAVAASIAVLKKTDKSSVTEREWLHIKSALTCCDGDMRKTCTSWMEILMKYPMGKNRTDTFHSLSEFPFFLLSPCLHFSLSLDVYAVRLVFDFTLQLGWFEQMRSTMASFMVHVPKNLPLYPYLLSLWVDWPCMCVMWA